jgi:hypothetical protein
VKTGTNSQLSIVIAGLGPAIHEFSDCRKDVDDRDKPGHDSCDGSTK